MPILSIKVRKRRLSAPVWRTLFRNEALRQHMVSDPHSPGQILAVNPLRNVDAWYAAWKIDPSQKQYLAPANRVPIL